jgi:hypothetical protein
MLNHDDEIRRQLGVNVDIQMGNRLIEHGNQGHPQHPKLEGDESDILALRVP